MTMRVTIYDRETGEIVKRVTCTTRTLPLYLAEKNSFDYVEGHWDDLKYIVVDGVAVERDEHLSKEPEDPRSDLDKLRDERNRRLAYTDWTQLPDNALTEQKRNEWAVYRQALRDITEGDPENPQWPQPPE